MPSTPKPTVLSAADNRAPPRPTLLPHFLALSYTALIVYASLHPLTGWRDPGISPFYFLDANLAARHPERFDALRQQWLAWNATIPAIPDDAAVSLGYSTADMPQR